MLLGDAHDGDATLFVREDTVAAGWRTVAPILDRRDDVIPYAPGSWGPSEADLVLAAGDRWWSPST